MTAHVTAHVAAHVAMFGATEINLCCILWYFYPPPFFFFKLQYILCLSKIDPALKTQLEGVFLSSMQIKLRCFLNVLGGKNLLFCSE